MEGSEYVQPQSNHFIYQNKGTIEGSRAEVIPLIFQDQLIWFLNCMSFTFYHLSLLEFGIITTYRFKLTIQITTQRFKFLALNYKLEMEDREDEGNENVFEHNAKVRPNTDSHYKIFVRRLLVLK